MARIVSFGGHEINDGVNYEVIGWEPPSPPPSQVEAVEIDHSRPLIGAVALPVHTLVPFTIRILDTANKAVLRSQLLYWFDADDCDAYPLVIEDDGGGNDRYVYAKSVQIVEADGRQGIHFTVTLVVHGDVRWRSTTLAGDVWLVDGESGQKTINNDGDADAYPVLTVQPTGIKEDSNPHRSFVPVRWRRGEAVTKYPVDIANNAWDTAALIAASKMQSAGEDIRLLVDGVETDFWLQDIDTSTTQVWANLDFEPQGVATLVAAITDAETVTEIDVNESIAAFPSSGILQLSGITGELFTYTGKNNALRRFTGVTRAAKGTSAANHSAGANVFWIQRDIWITYGDPAAAAYVPDDDDKPIFELNSTNTSWVYEEFGEDDGLRSGAWSFANIGGASKYTSGSHFQQADPWVEMGIFNTAANYQGYWYLYNPVGITNANFTNGEKFASLLEAGGGDWTGRIQSSINGSTWITEHTIPVPTVVSTWQAWSQNEALATGSKYVALNLSGTVLQSAGLEVADVTITLDSSNAPQASVFAEQGNYTMAATITNETTGQALTLQTTMALDQELELDTDSKTVTLLDDGSSRFAALELVGGPRRDWLKLAPGSNVLDFANDGANGVTISVAWQERYYT